MVRPGNRLVSGRIPGERIETSEITSPSSDVTTTETTVASVTADVVSGRTYRITADVALEGSVAGDRFSVRIREDDSSGAQLQRREFDVEYTDYIPYHLEVEFPASSTVSKTFVVTLERESGSGDLRINAFSSRPSYLYVDYVRG